MAEPWRRPVEARPTACCRIRPVPRGAVEAGSPGELARLLRACRVVFVFFKSPMCPYCAMMEPLVDEAAEQLSGRALFVKVDVYQMPEAAWEAGVMATPTLVALVGGREVDRVVGALPPEYLEEFINHALKAGGCMLVEAGIPA